MSDISNRPEPPPTQLTEQQLTDWLNWQWAPLFARREAILAALQAMTEAHPQITDEEIAGQFVENLGMARDVVDAAGVAHKDEKAPYWTSGKVVDQWQADFIQPLAEAIAPAARVLFDYATQKEAAARAGMSLWDAPASTAELSRVRGDFGAIAYIGTRWTWEITDFDLVPRDLLMVDPGKVRALMEHRDRATGRPLAERPGVKWVPVRDVQIRSRRGQ